MTDEKVVFNVPNIPKELMEKAKRLADEQDKPLAQVVRQLIREWVSEQEQTVRNASR